jgi:RND family efflux transporter MFP subunit
MKSSAWRLGACVLLVSCSRPAADTSRESPDLDALSVTRWTDRTELFAEYPPLIVGRTSRFAVHLTRLDTFRAVTEGRVDVRLSGGGHPVEVFTVDAPSRPGIFGVDVTPVHAGPRELAIGLRAPERDDEHLVGAVTVYADQAAARAAGAEEGAEGEAISFLKEQQWALEFATAVVDRVPLRQTVRVPAQVVARPGGTADVVAPVSGRLVRVVDAPLGSAVTEGQELARLLPPPSAPGELPSLKEARAAADAALRLATRDRERAERLVEAGAAPQKRLDEARSAEEQTQVRLAGADARLAQYDAARTAGAGSDEGQFVVRAPISGVIAERSATTGANVVEGAALFRVVDVRQMAVVGQIPENELARARPAREAELEVPGQESLLPVGALSSLGRVLDARTRTAPITFALDNGPLGLAVGQTVFLHLHVAQADPQAAVPTSAVVDDAGRPIVFVQREGEAFERRPVTLGARAGNVVQVMSGVSAGERVVSRGAYLVRLASLSTQVPSHGHVH